VLADDMVWIARRMDIARHRITHFPPGYTDIVGFVADSSDDAIRELVECLYGAMDKRDTSTFDVLVSPRVVVEDGSSSPIGLDETTWRTRPDGHARAVGAARRRLVRAAPN
jgi:hypothetical protein